MKVRHYNGAETDVPEAKARSLVAGGTWVYVDKAPEVVSREPEPLPETEDTPETVEAVTDESEAPEEAGPSIPAVRKWALEKEFPGVKPRGKLSRDVIEAYITAHKE